MPDRMPAERVLFVHAHPDDESIVTGGTIASLRQRGVPVTVLTCTRGEKGEVIPADISHLEGDDDALAAHRGIEARAAMTALGVDDHRYLGDRDARRVDLSPRRYRDSGMRWGPHGPEPLETMEADALCAADPREVAADIATVITATGAAAVVGYAADGGYGHPDHVAAHVAARMAAEAMGVPFHAIVSARDAAPAGSRPAAGGTARISVDVGPVLDRKIAALRAYRSQLTVDGADLRMPGGQVEPISVVEEFDRLDSRVSGADGSHPDPLAGPPPATSSGEWARLGRGARVVVCAGALLLGAVVAAIGTVVHQVRPQVLGVGIPVGLVLSLLVVAALLAGLRLAFDSRLVATLGAVAFLAVVNLLSMRSAGGSVLIDDSPLAYWWVYTPVAIAFLVLAWPRLPARGRVRIEAVSASKGSPTP
jgi:N-acetyl-1-D-myo-inositol-2-amino-2-deoxy-alpha-D-glucopyranoside deacetylase